MADLAPLAPRLTPARPKIHKLTTKERGYGADWERLRLVIMSEAPICEMCSDAWTQCVHHRDHNPTNNLRTNLQGLCFRCHNGYHAKHRRANLHTK